MKHISSRPQPSSALPWADGCVYEAQGVVCRLPEIYGTVPIECRSCGWNPAVSTLRKFEIREQIESGKRKKVRR